MAAVQMAQLHATYWSLLFLAQIEQQVVALLGVLPHGKRPQNVVKLSTSGKRLANELRACIQTSQVLCIEVDGERNIFPEELSRTKGPYETYKIELNDKLLAFVFLNVYCVSFAIKVNLVI